MVEKGVDEVYAGASVATGVAQCGRLQFMCQSWTRRARCNIAWHMSHLHTHLDVHTATQAYRTGKIDVEAAFDEFVGPMDEAPLEVGDEELFHVRDRNIAKEFEDLNHGARRPRIFMSRAQKLTHTRSFDTYRPEEISSKGATRQW